MAKRKLGEVLLESRTVSISELDAAIDAQKNGAGRLGEILLSRNAVDKSELVAALKQMTGVAYLDCFQAQVEREALDLVPLELAQRHCALPVRREGKRLVVIMAEPQDLLAFDEIRFAARH